MVSVNDPKKKKNQKKPEKQNKHPSWFWRGIGLRHHVRGNEENLLKKKNSYPLFFCVR